MTTPRPHSHSDPDEGYIGGQEETRSMSDNDGMMQVDETDAEAARTSANLAQALNTMSDEEVQKQAEVLFERLPLEYRYGP